jgi:hypothetical protein
MRHDPPVLEYAGTPATRRRRRDPFPWQSLVAIFGGAFFIPPFMCVCGHLGVEALVSTIPMAALATWGCSVRTTAPLRVVAFVVCVVAYGVLTKNLIDISWYGHDPIFR